jgi:hypothetical protein
MKPWRRLKREEDKALVDSGKMRKEEFVANALIEPGYPPFLAVCGQR